MLLMGCTTPAKNFPPATTAIEAARNYIEAGLQGDFEKAYAYAAINETMKSNTALVEKKYRTFDKEGRSNYRQASIIILNITDQDSLHTTVNYQYSFDKVQHTILVQKNKGGWLVAAVN